jgi:hypothetical protein
MRFRASQHAKSKINTISNQRLSVFGSDFASNRIANRNESDILSITEAKTKSIRDCETALSLCKVLRKAGERSGYQPQGLGNTLAKAGNAPIERKVSWLSHISVIGRPNATALPA